ncbi:hypothetical protein C8R46DRAFT_283267 [Mycena filopes]|nr:hypothetical protein C8R46DRAFT_283267 [Mycena filopes]
MLYVASATVFVLDNTKDEVFNAALLSSGIVPALVRTASALAKCRDSEDDLVLNDRHTIVIILDAVWAYLEAQIIRPLPNPSLREAICAGLLRAIIATASNDTDSFISDYLQGIVTPLKLYTAFYSVLSALEPALHDIVDLQASPAFVRCDLFDAWSMFWDLAQIRIDVMKRYDSDDYVSLKACANLECGDIYRKRDLMSCSACKLQYYCSRRCQSVDWNDGHRAACPQMISLNQNEFLNTRDKSFLRALLDHEYKRHQSHILQWELDFMHAHPTDTPCLIFDFSKGRGKYHFGGASGLAREWGDDVTRAARSGGRIQLHLVWLPHPKTITQRMLPMQSSSGALAQGMKRLKEELDGGVGGSAPLCDQLQSRLCALINLTREDTHVH